MVPRCTATTFNGRACATSLESNKKGKKRARLPRFARVLHVYYQDFTHFDQLLQLTALLLTNLTRSTRRSYSAVAAHQFLNLFAKLLPLSLINIFTVINPMPWASCRMVAMNISMIQILSSTGCPQKTHFQNAAGATVLAQLTFDGTPCVWRLIFWSFLTETKQDQSPPSYVNGKI